MPRPAKTERENWLQGTTSQVGRSKPTPAASVYAGGRPKIPQHLDKLARAEFKRVCRELEQRKTLTSGDRLTIAVLAECYSRWCQAKEELGTSYTIQATIADKKGNMITTTKMNPLVKVVEAAEARMVQLQGVLGLTPQARDKVRQTSDKGGEAVVPGSMGDLYPEICRPSNVVPMQPAQIDPRDMTASDEEEEHEPEESI